MQKIIDFIPMDDELALLIKMSASPSVADVFQRNEEDIIGLASNVMTDMFEHNGQRYDFIVEKENSYATIVGVHWRLDLKFLNNPIGNDD